MRNVRDPEAPDTVCDFCEGMGQTYAQNTSPIHIHELPDGAFHQFAARPDDGWRPSDVLHSDPDACRVVVGMAHNATQDVLVCNRPLPCSRHDQ